MESNNDLQSLRKSVEDLLGSAIFANTGFWNYINPGTIIRLNDELADHIIQMYNDTNWGEIDEDLININLPEFTSTGDLDVEAFRKHIGQHIIISLYGEPWPGIIDAPVFILGAGIDFPNRLLDLVGDIMWSLRDNNDLCDVVYYLGLAALAMKADNVPDTLLQKTIKDNLEIGHR